MGRERIAIVGMGLKYPDANSAGELWDNVLAGRRAFRTMPEQRTSLADYFDPDPNAADKFYSSKAAVLRDFEFDRVKWRVSASTFRSTDMTHWLALDTCDRALAVAGFTDGDGLPKETTGVILGNTLTGEFSRASQMRLRWPYVRRTVADRLSAQEWTDEQVGEFLAELETTYKAPFAPVTEDTLAGGLANTIAGRVCNYFDLGGGGFTVDGACSSSLLAVVDAASALQNGDLDVAICGGVDLSIDPFEVIGFAKTGALATREMLVYDDNSNGFWPGEGCGILVLMREEDAREQGRNIYAFVSGWGVSSDGKGGITRPEASGHRRAIRRAYERAGYSVGSVSYFEGHGTGTALGDATEISALAGARRDSDAEAPAALGSIKANIGHTKAAAGVAGIIKATLALHHNVVPPATGQRTPHSSLVENADMIRVPHVAEPFPVGKPARAGVSAMGFGGINVHIAMEANDDTNRTTQVSRGVADLVRTRQDCELLLFTGNTREDLMEVLHRAAKLCSIVSEAELTDLAVNQQKVASAAQHRVGIVVSSPDDAVSKIERALDLLEQGEASASGFGGVGEDVYYGFGDRASIAFAFPGQAAGSGRRGAVARRFEAREVSIDGGEDVRTDRAQPRIVAASVMALGVLADLNIDADTAVGHSLGELVALAWSGAMTDGAAIELAAVRGHCMQRHIPTGGTMVAVVADASTTSSLLSKGGATVSGFNAPEVTIVAGADAEVDAVVQRARARKIGVVQLNVPYAFHTAHCELAAQDFSEQLRAFTLLRPQRPVLSTTLGGPLNDDVDVAKLLAGQITSPVQFLQASEGLQGYGLVIEVGPGSTLKGLLRASLDSTSVVTAVDTDSDSLRPFLGSVAAAFAAGAELYTEPLYRGRVARPLHLSQDLTFLENPCEAVPVLSAEVAGMAVAAEEEVGEVERSGSEDQDTLTALRHALADRVELPFASITAQTNPLDDLHMSSITIGDVVNEVVRAVGKTPGGGVPAFATATVAEIADLIDELDASGAGVEAHPAGLGPWVSVFTARSTPSGLRVLPQPAKQVPDQWTSVGANPAAMEELSGRLSRYGLGSGVVVNLLGTPVEQRVPLLTAFIQALDAQPEPVPLLVLDEQAHGAAAAAKTALLEGLASRLTLVTIPDPGVLASAQVLDSIAADVLASTHFTHVIYPDGQTRESVDHVSRSTRLGETPSPLSSKDVLLATGGARGITAEAAISLVVGTGAKLALLGRSSTDEDQISATSDRLTALGIVHSYVQADVTDAQSVQLALAELQEDLGQITAVLHGAGVNIPARAETLTEADFARALAPKVDGLRHVLEALAPDQLAWVLAFGSIIGRAGLAGEAHYATANAWLADDIAHYAAAHPNVRALCLEWSVWAGTGMGESLGVLDALRIAGIEPIPTADGVAALKATLADLSLPAVMVVSGRTGNLPTLPVARADLPLRRFLDSERVHYSQLELIVDTELSATSDRYLADHDLDGTRLFPAVMGLEAMAEATRVVAPEFGQLAFEEVNFKQPIVVNDTDGQTLRVVAQRRGDCVDVALRCSATDFSVDHFTATVRSDIPDVDTPELEHQLPLQAGDAKRDLYGRHMFQGDRFQALTGYRLAGARRLVADLTPQHREDWYGRFLPGTLELPDPDARDAMMHALQCCVPDAVLLPISVDRIVPAQSSPSGGAYRIQAIERDQQGDVYTYDVTAFDDTDTVCESWRGLRLRAVRKRALGDVVWAAPMLSGFLQRGAEQLLETRVQVSVEPHEADLVLGPQERRAVSDRALRRLAPNATIHRADDGRLLSSDGEHVCTSHDVATLAVRSDDVTACDIESVIERPELAWSDLLGSAFSLARVVAEQSGEDLNQACTRVWGALECIRKTGRVNARPVLSSVEPGGEVVFAWGRSRIVSWVVAVAERSEPVMISILGGRP